MNNQTIYRIICIGRHFIVMCAIPLVDAPAGRFKILDIRTSHVVLESCYAIQLYIVALYNTVWFFRRFPSDGHETEAAYIVVATNNDEIFWRTGHWKSDEYI